VGERHRQAIVALAALSGGELPVTAMLATKDCWLYSPPFAELLVTTAVVSLLGLLGYRCLLYLAVRMLPLALDGSTGFGQSAASSRQWSVVLHGLCCVHLLVWWSHRLLPAPAGKTDVFLAVW
jgi:hypothetical protein